MHRAFFEFSQSHVGIIGGLFKAASEVFMRVQSFARLAALSLSAALVVVPQWAGSGAFAAPLPSISLPAAALPPTVEQYNSACERYRAALGTYLAHGRRNVSEYTVALRAFTSAQQLLQIAQRDIAKQFKTAVESASRAESVAVKAATAAYNLAMHNAKTPEQRAAAANARSSATAAAAADRIAAIAVAAADRDNATNALLTLPPAPPKVLRG